MPNLNDIPKAYKIPKQERKTRSDPYLKTHHWQKLRLQALKRDAYTCQICKAEGIIKVVGITRTDHAVDHIKPTRLFPELIKDMDNLQTLCRSCHDTKTRAEQNVFTREDWELKFND